MSDISNSSLESKGLGLLCPVCRVDLVMTERQGIEIDYCPKCRGVWLDRGELDKIIERSVSEEGRGARPETSAPPQGQPYPQERYDNSGSHHGDRQSAGHGRRRGHGSFLGRLFD